MVLKLGVILRYLIAFLASFLLSTLIIRKGIPKLHKEATNKGDKQLPQEPGEVKPDSKEKVPLLIFAPLAPGSDYVKQLWHLFLSVRVSLVH